MTWLGQRRRPSGSSGWNASMKEKKTSPTRSVKASLLLPDEVVMRITDAATSEPFAVLVTKSFFPSEVARPRAEKRPEPAVRDERGVIEPSAWFFMREKTEGVLRAVLAPGCGAISSSCAERSPSLRPGIAEEPGRFFWCSAAVAARSAFGLFWMSPSASPEWPSSDTPWRRPVVSISSSSSESCTKRSEPSLRLPSSASADFVMLPLERARPADAARSSPSPPSRSSPSAASSSSPSSSPPEPAVRAPLLPVPPTLGGREPASSRRLLVPFGLLPNSTALFCDRPVDCAATAPRVIRSPPSTGADLPCGNIIASSLCLRSRASMASRRSRILRSRSALALALRSSSRATCAFLYAARPR
mmetsp:Transcript_38331/g.84239  ORF Transcript_38331/g.84239 Transcript_38331/m.84239 type:complete len:360 (-) Transcript_38331:2752-3831(-)